MTRLKSAVGLALATTALTFAGITALPAQGFDIVAFAPPDGKGPNKDKDSGDDTTNDPPTATADTNWMHSVMGSVTMTGVGSHITLVDFYSNSAADQFAGRLVDVDEDGRLNIDYLSHGYWTAMQAGLVAPDATVHQHDWDGDAIGLHTGFDVVNASYGLIARASFASAYNDWSLLGDPHQSILVAARDDKAFVAKAAGNDSAAVGEVIKGTVDVFGQQLIGLQGAVFVGALEWNPDNSGEGGTKEGLASYSNFAGSDPTVQNQFLVVGVEGGRTSTDEFAAYGSKCTDDVVNGTCLYGTSFAAPIVAGYAALMGEKFTFEGNAPSPALVADRLLTTARTDTLVNIGAEGWDAEDMAVYGMGEADIYNALATSAPLTAN